MKPQLLKKDAKQDCIVELPGVVSVGPPELRLEEEHVEDDEEEEVDHHEQQVPRVVLRLQEVDAVLRLLPVPQGTGLQLLNILLEFVRHKLIIDNK